MSSIFDIYDEPLNITLLNTKEQISIRAGTPAIEFLPFDPEVVAVYSNNELLSLQEGIDIESQIQPVKKSDLKESIGMLTDTLAFLVQAAAVHCFPGLTLELRYKIQRGMYFSYNDLKLTDDDIERLTEEINRLICLNIPLLRTTISHNDAIEEMKRIKHMKACELLCTLNNPKESMVELQAPDYNFKLVWRSPMLPHTGFCEGMFKLIPYNNGFICRYSDDFKSLSLEPVRKSLKLQNQLCQILDLYVAQAKAIGLESIAHINQLVSNPKKLADAITFAEFNHERQIGEVAAHATSKTKIIFIAGPSSSGKTTFANRVSCHLRAKGFEPIRISLDDYYGEPSKAPRIPGTSKPDFEHLEALNLDRIRHDLTSLINGEETVMAMYDFVQQKPKDGRTLKLSPQGILVVEGIHALNDEITKVVPPEKRLRVFIQPVGALPWDETRVIDFYLTRLMRRMCRDYLFRGRTAD